VGMRFIIDGLPRTGSTSLARMLSCHRSISCMIEPFHPSRYGGQYRQHVRDSISLQQTLDLIWLRWVGIKHVWEAPTNWPFESEPILNEELIRCAPAVISIERRNLLQRYISSLLSRRLRFWIGTKAEFLRRLETTGFPELNVEQIREAIAIDLDAIKRRRLLLSSVHSKFMFVNYEDLFGDGVAEADQVSHVNHILRFLGHSELTPSECLQQEWKESADSTIAKWNTVDIYSRIPGIHRIEATIGSDETGWLFR